MYVCVRSAVEVIEGAVLKHTQYPNFVHTKRSSEAHSCTALFPPHLNVKTDQILIRDSENFLNLFFSFAHPKLKYPTVAAVGYYATEFLGQTLSYCAVEESRVYTTLPANSLPQLWVTGFIGWFRQLALKGFMGLLLTKFLLAK